MMHTLHLMMAMGGVEDAKGGIRENKKGGGKHNVPIGHTSDGALLELHHVAGQGSRLVRENVFHLHRQRHE